MSNTDTTIALKKSTRDELRIIKKKFGLRSYDILCKKLIKIYKKYKKKEVKT